MNSPSRFVKITALSCSVLLLSGFVALRSGAFDEIIKDETAFTGPLQDTPKKDSVQPRPRMSGSKSMVLIEPVGVQDSAKKDNSASSLDSANHTEPKNSSGDKGTQQRPIMYGSKSGPVYTAPDTSATKPKK
ncbi:MAG TPA: hypothetical protein VI731_06875 [Bacteroidia bacterium]|nr:hypothetical protein [Bacteroidia bacterium]